MRSLAPFLVGLCLALSSVVAQAQSRAIVFTNALNREVLLVDGSELEINADGTVHAECLIDGEDCVGLGPTGPVPEVTLIPSATNVLVNQGFSLHWNVIDGFPGACLGSSSPGVTNWTGAAFPPTNGTATFILDVATTYQFQLSCFTVNGVGSASVQVTVSEPPPSPATCTDSGPGIDPPGYTRIERSWGQVFNGMAAPNTPGFPMPVGSFSLGGASVTGTYLSIPFQMPAGTTRAVQWVGAQPVVEVGYFQASPAHTALVAISPCAGDLRAPQAGSPLLSQCRDVGIEKQVVFGTAGAGCPLVAGATYYLNVLLDDPTTLTPGSNACINGSSCDILMKVAQ